MLFRFRKFRVYQEAQTFRKEIYRISRSFPKDELYALTSQIRRAAMSICLNIAEGSNRSSDIDFARFLNQSITSLEEVVACFDAALDEGYITKVIYQDVLGKAESLGKQLLSFYKKLKAHGSEL